MITINIQKYLFKVRPKVIVRFATNSCTSKYNLNHLQSNTSAKTNHKLDRMDSNEDTSQHSDTDTKLHVEKEWVYDQKGVGHFVAKSNKNFEAYYFAQSTCSSESEWHNCIAAMRRELPQGFRVDLQRASTSKQIISLLNKLSTALEQINLSSKDRLILRKMAWCENDSVWQLKDVGRWKLKSNVANEDESSKNLLNFLYHENELGHISRQELVSQVPVLLLGIKPHHKVLDMCASPGSKTKQVLSLLHHPERNSNHNMPPGLIIANEDNPDRCDKLTTNLKKQSSPCLITVNQDAQIFPDIHLNDSRTNEKQCLKYDRIVCDVPCSGDGTIRKNPTVWNNWTPASGNARHHLQYNIVERGVELLEIGGLMAYSSCAINPIENEAVIGRLLSASKGSLELVDVTGQLPSLNWAPGHTSWHVFDPNMRCYDKYIDVPDKYRKKQIRESMFSCLYPKTLHLDRSMRLLPHHNDCGGFYVAIIRKKSVLPWENGEINQNNMNDYDLSARVRSNLSGLSDEYESLKYKRRKQTEVKSRPKRIFSMKQDPNFFTYIRSNDANLQSIFKFYNFPQDEQFVDTSLFYTPDGKQNQFYMTNDIVKRILQENVINRTENKDLNVFYAGSKVIEKESKTKSTIDLKGKTLLYFI